MSAKAKPFVLVAAAVAIIFLAAWGTMRVRTASVAVAKLDDSEARARAATSASTTPYDAKQWLEANGFEVIFWNPRDPSGFIGQQQGTDGKFLVVEGYRGPVAPVGMGKDEWFYLSFRFGFDESFKDVKSSWMSFAMPKNRKPGN